jgi:hypothetical protein
MSSADPLVNGLPLPGALVALLEAGRWRRPDDVGRLCTLTGLHDAGDLLFCDVVSMAQNTEQLVAELDRNAALFGLASSARGGVPVADRSVLDVDQCVVVACTSGDGLVCLDYRAGRERPVVVVSDWGAGPEGQVAWRTIALDIERFAEEVGL